MNLIGEIKSQETQSLSCGMVNFGEYMRDLRKSSGVTQFNLAKVLGYTSPQFISNYERGLCYPAPNTLKTISEVLKVNYEPVATMYINCKKMDLEETLGVRVRKGA